MSSDDECRSAAVEPVDTEIPLLSVSLPIHTLPVEVLIQIFQHFLPSHDSFIDRTGSLKCPWARLMCVCRRWCAIIRNTACFWRDVTVHSKDVRWLHLALRRLGDAPVRIALIRNLKTVLPILIAHADRIEELSFAGSIHDPGVTTVLSSSFPILNKLAVSLEDSAHNTALPAFGGEWPLLGTLFLTRVSLPWSTSILSSLETLSLVCCQLSTPPIPLADFLNILGNGQNLRDLHLTRFLSAAISTQSAISHEPLVTLPVLQRFVCRDEPARIEQLMAHLHAPGISYLELAGQCVDVHDPHGILSGMLTSLLPRDATRLPILQRVSSVVLEVARTRPAKFLYGSPSVQLALLRNYLEPPSTAGEMEAEVRRLPAVFGVALTQLSLEGVLEFSPGTWDAVLGAFPALRRLTIRNCSESGLPELPAGLLHSLQAAPGAEEAHPGRRVRCPVLKELELAPVPWNSSTADVIMECFQSRAASGAPRLERLYIAEDRGLRATVDTHDADHADHGRERLRDCAGPIKLQMSVNEHLSIWDMEPELLRLPMVFGSALTELRLDGVLSFSATTWDILFDAFPALQTLSLNDYGWAPEPTMVDDLFRSLQSASTSHSDNARDPEIGEVHRPVRCAVLKELTIDPVWWIPRTVVAVLECLRSRAASGTPRLEHLTLRTRDPGPVRRGVEEHHVDRLRELVDQFVLAKET